MKWTEKYRPKDFQEVVGNREKVKRVKLMVEGGDIPDILFVGRAGVGKTTLGYIIAEKIFGKYCSDNLYVFNASKDRGINVVRSKISGLAKQKPLAYPYKIIFLDEADYITREAQASLRTIMEDYSEITKFILSVNYPHKLIEPIRSRCLNIELKPLQPLDIFQRLNQIAKTEYMDIEREALIKIAKNSFGDMRPAINTLQELSALNRIITVSDVGITDLDQKEIINILKVAMGEKSISKAQMITHEYILKNGTDERIFLAKINDLIRENPKIPDEIRGKIHLALAETDYRLMIGGDPIIQLDALITRIIFICATSV